MFFHVFMIYDDIDNMICLLADVGPRGRPLAFLIDHDPRHMGVAGDTLVP